MEREHKLKMKKSPSFAFLLQLFIGCLLLFAVVMFLQQVFPTARERMQADLASELGVRIEDYPYSSAFPTGYFFTVLQPGMTATEVHQIVIHYKKVVKCGNRSEIYYYFSTDLKDAKRFMLVYDDQGHFVRIEGEEDDSRTLQTFGCIDGLIQTGEETG